MKHTLKSKFLSLFLLALTAVWTLQPQAAQATFFAGATEPSQIAHSATNNAGWLWDAQAWMQDRLTDLDKLLELVENNVLTRSIRGFNELMTAIQGDISDVLGTVDTLMNAPADIIGSLTRIPSTVFSMFQGAGSGFEGLFGQFTNTFNDVGDLQSQIGSGYTGSLFGSGRDFNSAFELSNQLSGARSKLSSQFLQDSQRRQNMYDSWEQENNRSVYGKDTVQIEATQADILTEVVRNQNRDQEFAMMDRMQQNAERMMIYEREKARTDRMYSDTHYNLINQIW